MTEPQVKRPPARSLRLLVRLLGLGGMLALLMVFGIGSLAVDSVLRRVEEESDGRRVRHVMLLLERRLEITRQRVEEYAYWDATWKYVDHPVGAEASRFVHQNFVDWFPRRYGDRFVGIWSANRQPVLTWPEAAAPVRRSFESTEFFDLLLRRRSAGGFIRTPEGLYIAGGALVLPTAPPAEQIPSNGFVAVAQPVTSALLKEIEGDVQGSVRLLPVDSTLGHVAPSRQIAGGDSLESRMVLGDFFGRPSGVLVLTSSRLFLRDLSRWLHRVFAGGVLLGGMVFAGLWLAANRLVLGPLGRLASDLERMQRTGRLEPLAAAPPAAEWDLFVRAFNGTVEQLHASEQTYRTLFSQAKDALFFLDGDSQIILDANPAAAALTGRPRGAMLGSRMDECLRMESADYLPIGTLRLHRGDGQVLIVGVATSAVEISGQRRTLASFRDFTERESLEAKLRQAQKMEAIGSLAGGIAHDFNNLLGSVLMELAALQEQMGAGHPARESIDTITRVTRRGTELTRQLLGFARREPHKEGSLSLNDVVASVEHLCARTFDPGVTIESRLALDLPLTLGDAGQIEQALLNLCINARDAMPGGGTITLSTRTAYLDEASGRAVGNLAAGNYVVLSVTDTGVGMTAEVRQRLFEPFFTTKERGKGTGLGLAMVHGIIQGHRGGVGVWSEPDKGTRIDLCLPLVAPPAPTGDAEPPRPVALPGTETVLVIDDEAPLRRAVVRALERLGYTVLQAENGRVGIALFEKHRDEIEIVLLDVAMPEMSGVEVFRRLRAGREDVPVLVCSGYAETAELQTLHLEGADGFLNKPFDVVDLARAVRAVLDERAVTVGARRPLMESKPG